MLAIGSFIMYKGSHSRIAVSLAQHILDHQEAFEKGKDVNLASLCTLAEGTPYYKEAMWYACQGGMLTSDFSKKLKDPDIKQQKEYMYMAISTGLFLESSNKDHQQSSINLGAPLIIGGAILTFNSLFFPDGSIMDTFNSVGKITSDMVSEYLPVLFGTGLTIGAIHHWIDQ